MFHNSFIRECEFQIRMRHINLIIFPCSFYITFTLNENSMGCIFQDQYEYIGPKLARARNNYLLDGLTFKLVGFPSTYGKLLIVCLIITPVLFYFFSS